MAEIDASLSDDEVLAEVRADGDDPDQIAMQVDEALMRGFHEAQRKKLQVAVQEHAQRVTELAKKTPTLPATAEARRTLLGSVFAQQPAIRTAILTVHHRDLTGLTDNDVQGYLEDFMALGVLDQLDDASNPSA